MPSGGSGGAGGAGGREPTGSGGLSGSGGKQPDPVAGTSSVLSCDEPYAPPTAGPRLDGPEPIRNCSSVDDSIVIARFKSGPRTPRGMWFEPDEAITFWKDPCSSSLKETVERGPTDPSEILEGQAETAWFYEAAYCFMGVRRRIRNLRCDYFDGQALGNTDPSTYGLFASLLWWRQHGTDSGAAMLGYSMSIGDSTSAIELCTIEGTRGDFGLCDEIRLVRTVHRIMAPNEVRLGMPEVLRVVKGDCH